jgi:protein required for attachment to host cells
MKKHKIDHGTWIALCDGARSLILSNFGDEKFFNFRTVDAAEGNRRRSHEMGNDRPPRAHESVGNRRSAIETPDKHDEEEKRFLREFADRLHLAVTTGLTESIILISPPRALGHLRGILSDAVRHAVRYEFDKDFLKLTIDELEVQLKSLLSKE